MGETLPEKKGLLKYQTWPNACVFVFVFSKLNCDTSRMLAPLGVIVDSHLSHCKHLQSTTSWLCKGTELCLPTLYGSVESWKDVDLKPYEALWFCTFSAMACTTLFVFFKISCLPRSFWVAAKELHQDLEVVIKSFRMFQSWDMIDSDRSNNMSLQFYWYIYMSISIIHIYTMNIHCVYIYIHYVGVFEHWICPQHVQFSRENDVLNHWLWGHNIFRQTETT